MINHGSHSAYSYHKCRCDICVAAKHERDREYYLKNREARKQKAREWATANPERKRAVAKQYREANAEVLRAKKQAKYAADPQPTKDRAVAWKKANPDKVKASTAKYREAHRDEIRVKSMDRYRKQMEEDPEKVRAQRRKFQTSEKGRAYQRVANYRRRSLPMSKEVRDWWLSLENPLCAYCNSALATEIDHIIPISKGGTNERDNLLPACRSCNASKNDKTVHEWKESLSGQDR